MLPQGLVPERYWVEIAVDILGQRQLQKSTGMCYCKN
jgi:hypothetical protein